MPDPPSRLHNAFRAVLIVATLGGLYLASRYSYLLFHSLVEIFSVVVACAIFSIAWNARHIVENRFFLLIGIGSLCVGGLDLLHFLSYKGMGIFPGYGANLPTQLWVAARYVQSVSLLAAPLFLGRKLRPHLTIAVSLTATALLVAAIFGGIFPDCFVDGAGLTPFKKGSEYLVAGMFVCALVAMRRKERSFDPVVARLLTCALGLFIASELAFTLYTDVYGISNMVGHFLKFGGFFAIYKALIETALISPYNLLFRELKEREESYRQLSIERKEAAARIEVLNIDLSARAAELEESNCELETALDGLEAANHDLEKANHELAVANQELQAFNYSVSHDLRSPLTGIIGMSELLLDVHSDRLDQQGLHYLRVIGSEARRMDQLISTLLNFSRLGQQEIRRETVDLTRMAEGIAAYLRMSSRERRVSCTVADGLSVCADPRLLKVVMENLLGNAWKYTGNKEEAIVEVGSIPTAEGPVIFVCDNGAGFDMAGVDRLFQPFQRLHARAEFEGHGIGLATVRRIIERHGGRIWAEAEPDKGASFHFTLPPAEG